MKEADVRVKVDAILKKLGYKDCNIQREFPVDIQAGRGDPKKCFADYVISVNRKKRFVIEAKDSTKNISNKKIMAQARSYALNLNTTLFVVCNGKDFALYKTQDLQCILNCKIEKLSKIKEKIHRNQFEPKKRKTIIENALRGDVPKARDQLLNKGTNVLKKKAKTFLDKFIK